jgi:hypothetical protein
LSYILNDFSLLTHGLVAPTELDASGNPEDFCIGSFELLSNGIIVLAEADAGAGMADPYAGPSRFSQPFDRGYYIWKYGKNAKQPDNFAKQEPERPDQVRSSFIFDAWQEEAAAEAQAETLRLERTARALSLEQARSARDIRELNLYIAELTRTIESDLLSQAAALLADQARQQALIVRLEENRLAARDALLLVLERQRRQNNQLLAIESVIRFYY